MPEWITVPIHPKGCASVRTSVIEWFRQLDPVGDSVGGTRIFLRGDYWLDTTLSVPEVAALMGIGP